MASPNAIRASPRKRDSYGLTQQVILPPVHEMASPNAIRASPRKRDSYGLTQQVILPPVHEMASPNAIRASPRKRDSSALIQQGIPAPSNNIRAPRGNWDSFMTRTFLEIIAEVIEEEGQATTQLSKRQWTKICGKMYTRVQIILVPKQCQNRYNALKKDWQAWQLLANARRGATGIGWDPIRHTYTAPDHFWKNLESQNDIVGKFRDGPLEHEELMQRVFQGVTATGRFARTPGMPSRNPVDIDMDLSEGVGNTIGLDGGNEVEMNTGVEQMPRGNTPTHSRAMPVFPGVGSPTRKRNKTPTTSSELSNAMQLLMAHCSTKVHWKAAHTIGEAIKIITDMDYFRGDAGCPAYLWLIHYLCENPMKLDVFVTLPDDNVRLKFIQFEHAAACITAQAKPTSYGIPPPLKPYPPSI